MLFEAIVDDALYLLRRLLPHPSSDHGLNTVKSLSTRFCLLTAIIFACLTLSGVTDVFAPLGSHFISSSQTPPPCAPRQSYVQLGKSTRRPKHHKEPATASRVAGSVPKETSKLSRMQPFAGFITPHNKAHIPVASNVRALGIRLREHSNRYSVMVQTAGMSAPKIELKPFFDEEDVIADSLSLHNRWPHPERLMQRFITIRVFLRGDGTYMLCAVYNAYGVKDDGFGDSTISTWITAPRQDLLEWVVCDETSECKNSRFSNMAFATHEFSSTETDGWCVPLKSHSKELRVKFAGINKMKGIVFQSRHRNEAVQHFSGNRENGMTGLIDANGLVASGVIDEMYFSLQGR